MEQKKDKIDLYRKERIKKVQSPEKYHFHGKQKTQNGCRSWRCHHKGEVDKWMMTLIQIRLPRLTRRQEMFSTILLKRPEARDFSTFSHNIYVWLSSPVAVRASSSTYSPVIYADLAHRRRKNGERCTRL